MQLQQPRHSSYTSCKTFENSHQRWAGTSASKMGEAENEWAVVSCKGGILLVNPTGQKGKRKENRSKFLTAARLCAAPAGLANGAWEGESSVSIGRHRAATSDAGASAAPVPACCRRVPWCRAALRLQAGHVGRGCSSSPSLRLLEAMALESIRRVSCCWAAGSGR